VQVLPGEPAAVLFYGNATTDTTAAELITTRVTDLAGTAWAVVPSGSQVVVLQEGCTAWKSQYAVRVVAGVEPGDILRFGTWRPEVGWVKSRAEGRSEEERPVASAGLPFVWVRRPVEYSAAPAQWIGAVQRMQVPVRRLDPSGQVRLFAYSGLPGAPPVAYGTATSHLFGAAEIAEWVADTTPIAIEVPIASRPPPGYRTIPSVLAAPIIDGVPYPSEDLPVWPGMLGEGLLVDYDERTALAGWDTSWVRRGSRRAQHIAGRPTRVAASASGLLPPLSLGELTYNGSKLRLQWTMPPSERPDAVEIFADDCCFPPLFILHAVLPPDTTAYTFPVLPADYQPWREVYQSIGAWRVSAVDADWIDGYRPYRRDAIATDPPSVPPASRSIYVSYAVDGNAQGD
jgi:hypothetical protein